MAKDFAFKPPLASPGTSPIPSDHVRLYHQTDEHTLAKIKRTGLRSDRAKGIEGPKGIYADEKGFYGRVDQHPTVEFHVHKSRWDPPFVKGDVDPSDIVAVHKPWHQHARYIAENPDVLKAVRSGEHDDMLHDKEYGRAIRFSKRPQEK